MGNKCELGGQQIEPKQEAFDFVAQGFKEVDLRRSSHKIRDIEKRLGSRIIGQEKAITHVVRAFKKEKLRDRRLPFSVFLFSGPTGVGKTETAKEIARWFIGDDEDAPLVFIDGTSFSEPHSVSALIGAPPGYVGSSDDVAILSNENISRPFIKTMSRLNNHFKNDYEKLLKELSSISEQQATNSNFSGSRANKVKAGKFAEFYRKYGAVKSVILFDELEKASNEVCRILLNVIAEGKITLKSIGHEEVYFNNSIIVLTTNIGSEEIQRIISGKNIGFKNEETRDIEMDQKIYGAVKKAIELKFPAELIGRLKENLIVFRPLNEKHYVELIQMRILDVLRRCNVAGMPISLGITPNFEMMLIEKGFDEKYGARVLNQKIEKYIVESLCAAIDSGQVRQTDKVIFDYCDDKIKVFVKPRDGI